VGRALSSVSPTAYALLDGGSRCTVNCSNAYDYGPYSFHGGAAYAAMADVSVRLLSEDIEPVILLGLYSYDDGDVLPGF
jgi:hypothetical protein